MSITEKRDLNRKGIATNGKRHAFQPTFGHLFVKPIENLSICCATRQAAVNGYCICIYIVYT